MSTSSASTAIRFVQPTGLSGPAAYLKGIVDNALQTKTAVQLHPDAVLALKRQMLADPGNVQRFDITPRYVTGMRTQAIVFGGELYAKRIAITYPPMESWYGCGKAPAVLPR